MLCQEFPGSMGETCHGCSVTGTWKPLSQPRSATCWAHPSQAMPTAAPFALLAKQPWPMHLWFLALITRNASFGWYSCLTQPYIPSSSQRPRKWSYSLNYNSPTPAPCYHQSKIQKVLQWAHQFNEPFILVVVSRERNNLWCSIKFFIKSPIHLRTPKVSLLSTYTEAAASPEPLL